MNNATPNTTRNDDFEIRVERPRGISDERWDAAKRRIEAGAAPVISDALGECTERSWCIVAGLDEHAEHHVGITVDLVDSREPGQIAAAAAWLAERRDTGRRQLHVDASGEITGKSHGLDFEVADLWALFKVLEAGASDLPGDDVQQRIRDLLDEAI